TVEREEVFQVTYHNPADSAWWNLRKFRQLLLLGTPDDPWVATALEQADGAVPAPGVTRVFDVWARGQSVTVVTLPETGAGSALASLLPELRETYLERYRDWAHNRMFLTGPDSALADTLRQTAGFELIVPEVYRWQRRDSVFVFRNDNPDPSELIRQFTVTWRTPAPDSVSVGELLEWREELSRTHYEPRHVNDTTLMSTASLTVGGAEARRLQAVWRNPPEANWPAGGNFIVQTVRCPDQDRLYLIDAWLYAPGKEKFEYLYQLDTILDSFRCGASA
ncbi:MAG TPA: DUF4837 family protein, partial [Longimicrobiales bacterium]|nr:DUF4837 family protein [Longimicrobiales bacterium]